MKDVKIYHGKGCNECNFTGFWGRLAIYEILLITERTKQMIMKRQPAGDIKREAIDHGMRTLRQDGWQKVIQGLTTPGEVFEATPSDADVETDAEEEAEFIAAVKSTEIPARPALAAEKGADRRIFARLTGNVAVGYRIVKNAMTPEETDDDAPEQGAVTKDISAGGLAFFLKEGIVEGSILELRIELPSHKESIKCLAKVMRCQSIDGTPFFETAVYFLDLSGRDRQLLDKYVEKEKR